MSIGLLWGWLPAEVQSQNDTTLVGIDTTVYLQAVEIKGRYTNGEAIVSGSDTRPYIYHNLGSRGYGLILNRREAKLNLLSTGAELIEDRYAIRANDYGPGLSTMSQQGTGSQRTTVSYPIELRTPTTGVVDFSLLPPVLFTKYWGESERPSVQKTVDGHVVLGVGSFGERSLGLDFRGWLPHKEQPDTSRLSYQSRGTHLDLSLFGTQADNNFNIRDSRGRERQLPNADEEQLSSRLAINHVFNDRHQLYGSALMLTADRQIPPALEQLNSRARQIDRQLFSRVGYSFSTERGINIGIEGQYTDLSLRYVDPSLSLDATTKADSWLGILRTAWKTSFLGQEWLSLKTAWQHQSGSPNNGQPRSRDWLALSTAFKWSLGSRYGASVIHLRPRIEIGETGTNRPFVQLGASWYTGHFLLHYERSLRRPTLNDLFWPELGREDLEAERSHSFRIGFKHNESGIKHGFYPQFLAFHHFIRNAIRWLPEGGQFRPRNFDDFQSSGIEGGLNWLGDHWLLGTSAQYAYARNETRGRQIAYEPRLTVLSRIRYEAKRWAATYRIHYQSSVYTLNAADNRLPQTWLHHADFSYTFGRLELQLRLRNLFDLRYQRIAGYPLPGRHWRLQVIYSN